MSWLDKQQVLEAEGEQAHDPEEDARIEQELIDKAAETREENSYTLSSGETIWSVATKLGIDGKELLDHNDMTADQVVAGTTLHLLKPRNIRNDKTEIRYELFSDPEIMHISHAGGTRKFLFGNIRKWGDLKHSGPFFAEGVNVEIVASAIVPIGDDNAMYYMDAHALGKFKTTGRVAYTLGFSYKHLTQGAYQPPNVNETLTILDTPPEDVKVIPASTPNIFEEPVKPISDEAIAELDQAINPERHLELETELAAQGLSYKSSFRAFSDGHRRYQAIKDMQIRDIERRERVRPMHKFQHVTLIGTFWYDNLEYGRTVGSATRNDWYAIPFNPESLVWVDEPEPDEYMFDYSEAANMPLAERIASGYGHLSNADRVYIVWQRLLSDAVITKNKLIRKKK